MVAGGVQARTLGSAPDFVLPARPAYGLAGRAIVLHTNYFKLKGIKPDTHFYQYLVAFLDDDLFKRKKKRLIELLLKEPPFVGKSVASD
jgi:eukaryotic translation initiation factor 2C